MNDIIVVCWLAEGFGANARWRFSLILVRGHLGRHLENHVSTRATYSPQASSGTSWRRQLAILGHLYSQYKEMSRASLSSCSLLQRLRWCHRQVPWSRLHFISETSHGGCRWCWACAGRQRRQQERQLTARMPVTDGSCDRRKRERHTCAALAPLRLFHLFMLCFTSFQCKLMFKTRNRLQKNNNLWTEKLLILWFFLNYLFYQIYIMNILHILQWTFYNYKAFILRYTLLHDFFHILLFYFIEFLSLFLNRILKVMIIVRTK